MLGSEERLVLRSLYLSLSVVSCVLAAAACSAGDGVSVVEPGAGSGGSDSAGSAGSGGNSGTGGSGGTAGTGGSGASGSAGSGAAGSGGGSGSGAAGEGGEAGSGESGTAGDGGTAGEPGGAAGEGGEAGSGEGGAAGEGGEAGESGAGGSAGEAGAGNGGEAGEAGAGSGGEAGSGVAGAGGSAGEGGTSGEAGSGGFQSCATGVSVGETKLQPVDIIWMVDNSSSMEPTIKQLTAGLNNFANIIAGANLDYHVVMLSLRYKGSTTFKGSTRYGVCIPTPLAGDDNCGDGARFFQSSIDIKSTQPLEQFLGTLGQTQGFTAGEDRGGTPWKQYLREGASKTMIIVSDDNSRLSADNFLHFPGGKNPSNSTQLPPGILDSSWNGLFNKWIFHGLYGWGSESNPSTTCTFSGGSHPASSGPVYTQLIKTSGGARAQICGNASEWDAFLQTTAQAVVASSEIACELPIPPPPSGSSEINPSKVNVSFVTQSSESMLFKVDGPSGPSGCNPVSGGWYYDDPENPKNIQLCPASCQAANDYIGAGKTGQIEVTFGCNSVKN